MRASMLLIFLVLFSLAYSQRLLNQNSFCDVSTGFQIFAFLSQPEDRNVLLKFEDNEICNVAYGTIDEACRDEYFIFENLGKLSRNSLDFDKVLSNFDKKFCAINNSGLCDTKNREKLFTFIKKKIPYFLPINEFEYFKPECSKQNLTKLALKEPNQNTITHLGNIYQAQLGDNKVCKDCMELVEDLKTALSNDETEEKIAKGLSQQICPMLPDSLFEYCDMFIKTQIKSIIEILEGILDNEQVCESIFLCPGNSMERKNFNFLPESSTPNTILCASCITFMFKNSTDEINTGKLTEFARLFYNVFSFKFNIFSNAYFLNQMNPIEKCNLVGACQMAQREEKKISEPFVDEKTCQNCQDNILTILDKIEKVEEICNFSTKEYASICKLITYDLADKLNVLKNLKYDPLYICQAVNQCSVKRVDLISNELQIANELFDKIPSLFQGEENSCKICKSFLSDISWNIAKNVDKEEITTETLKTACSTLMDDLSYSICKSILRKIMGTVLSQVSKFTNDYDQICQGLNFCPKKFNKNETILFDKIIKNYKNVDCPQIRKYSAFNPPSKDSGVFTTEKSSLTCSKCEAILTNMKRRSLENLDEEYIIDLFVKDICRKPGANYESCMLQITGNWKLIKAGLKKMDTKLFCRIANVCGKNSVTNRIIKDENLFKIADRIFHENDVKTGLSMKFIERHPTPKYIDDGVKDEECSICKLVIETVYQYLEDNKNIDKIEEALDAVCSLLPGKYSDKCQKFVQVHIKVLIDVIEKKLPPQLACEKLNLCQRTVKKPSYKNVLCQECDLIIEYIYSKLSDDKTQEEIRKVLDHVCYPLPNSYKDKCLQIIDDYSVTLIRLLIEGTSPRQICEVLKFCPAFALCPKNDFNFICSSSFHAKICNAQANCSGKKWRRRFLSISEQHSDPCHLGKTDEICKDEEKIAKCNFEKNCIQSYYKKWQEYIQQSIYQNDSCIICMEMTRKIQSLRTIFVNEEESVQINCSIYPEGLERNACESVKTYKQNNPNMITSTLEDQQKICLGLKLCEYSTQNSIDIFWNGNCQKGPNHWCESVETALSCSTSAYYYCLNNVWNNQPSSKGLCRAGPSYFCKDHETATQCDAYHYCMNLPKKLTSENCMKGPSYWCQRFENALECGGIGYCRSKNHLFMRELNKSEINCDHLSDDVVCARENYSRICNKKNHCDKIKSSCQSGPGNFCKDEETARFCNMHDWCTKKGYFTHVGDKYIPGFLREDKPKIKPVECFWGAAYWCKDWEKPNSIAEKCGQSFVESCRKRISEFQSGDCSAGDHVRCANYVMAKSCNSIDYCTEKGLIKISTEVENQKYCDQGPAVWCQSMKNQLLCNKVEYCKNLEHDVL